MMGGVNANKNNLHMNKTPAMTNNMMMGKITTNGPMMVRGSIRNQQINSLPPNIAQRNQVSTSMNLLLYSVSLLAIPGT